MAKDLKGTVTAVTRRYIDVCSGSYETIRGKIASTVPFACVGDIALYQESHNTTLVTEILERKNLLRRSYGKKTKYLGANIDHLFIVSAPSPMFNTSAIDRVLTSARSENIPCTLIINKIDLEEQLEKTKLLIGSYKNADIRVIYTSCKTNDNLDELRSILNSKDLNTVALTGVSGVGKSSLINMLLPDLKVSTQEVSTHTGQGKQTTSRSIAHLYKRESDPLFLIDMPGIQKFGVTHLSKEEVKNLIPEFLALATNCQFNNCSHTIEPDCAVLTALKDNKIPESRYQSYKEMLEEVNSFEAYELPSE